MQIVRLDDPVKQTKSVDVAPNVIEDDDESTTLLPSSKVQTTSDAIVEILSPEKQVQPSLKPWKYDDFHNKMGHHGEERLCLQAKSLGYKLTVKRSSCDACNLVRSKAKGIPKVTKRKTTYVGERVGLDISGPFHLTTGKHHRFIQQKLFWYGITDHYSSKMISRYNFTKSELVIFV